MSSNRKNPVGGNLLERLSKRDELNRIAKAVVVYSAR